jgi:hypothetical protein
LIAHYQHRYHFFPLFHEMVFHVSYSMFIFAA